MARVQKANVILRVRDAEVERMLNLGYSLIDDNGAIISQCVPNDKAQLQKAYLEFKSKYENALKEIDKLEQEIIKLSAPKRSTKQNSK